MSNPDRPSSANDAAPDIETGYYSERRPSVYFRLGIRNEEVGSVYPLHHARFRVDEAALKNGALTLVSAATMFLAGQWENSGAQ
ncbi:hypothetical protein RFM68_24430 [Mesorhizobium sp. MSK_1335]|uniref:Amidohydrolase n=1 Tax=Mesorhizobium montanum TaxID=3072323 RepID=A0ABU4ZUP3_9HYPH|nr:hypothetical protein [Mesorhizobium sp. MSK_1335]MDX8527651.1 hypothetical protein [Mesorhizobium sp. MSK_1335]